MLIATIHWLKKLPDFVEGQKPLSTLSSAHLDAVRGLAAAAVFLGHWRSFWWPHYDKSATPFFATVGYFVTGFPHQSVIAFFVLSGFLVGGSTLRCVARWQWKGYLIARISRLWTVLIPALVVGYALDFWGTRLFGGPFYAGNSVPIYWDVGLRLSPEHLGCNALFLQTILCQPLGTNGVLWSLANEFWYYLIFPCVVLTTFGNSSVSTRIGYALAVIACIMFVGWNILLYFFIWLMGAAIPLFARIHLFGWRGKLTQSSAGVVAVACAVFSRLQESFFSDTVLGFAFALFIWTLICNSGKASPFYSKICGFISGMSYTLYLFHLPALVFISSILLRTELYKKEMALVSLILVSIFSYVMYFLFEMRTPQVRAWCNSAVEKLGL